MLAHGLAWHNWYNLRGGIAVGQVCSVVGGAPPHPAQRSLISGSSRRPRNHTVGSRQRYDFGLQAFRLPPLTPLQLWSVRQSVDELQIFTQAIAGPAMESHTDASGHSSVEPDTVHAVEQYPPGTLVLHVRPESQPLEAVHAEPTLGASAPHAARKNEGRIDSSRRVLMK